VRETTTLGNTIDVERALGDVHRPAFQIMLLALCGLCLVIDGFDAQAMGYVAPAVIADWHVSKAALGPVFSASLFGMLLGALGLSVLADRIGRRPVLIGATFFFGLSMIATALTTDLAVLAGLRFVTGLGLGCIMPNAMALVGEFSTPQHRVKRMMLVSCGFTLGAALGGFISAALIPAFGWQSVFWVGGTVPLLLACLMVVALPESLQFLVLKGREPRAKLWLSKFDPSLPIDYSTRLVVREKSDAGAPVAELFRAGRAPVTLILWAISFMNLIDLYFLSNWLPTVMRDAGYSQGMAVLVGTLLQTGGVLGTLILGWFIERFGFVRVLFACFAVGAVGVGAIGGVAHVLHRRWTAGGERARGTLLSDGAALDGNRLESGDRACRVGDRAARRRTDDRDGLEQCGAVSCGGGAGGLFDRAGCGVGGGQAGG
jgi:MFS transporter, AAHS family, 4-hydroxybenzoate transporter